MALRDQAQGPRHVRVLRGNGGLQGRQLRLALR